MSAKLIIVNPEDRADHQSEWSRHYASKRYVLWFGACGATYLMVWGHSLDDALETAADWLGDNAPGLIMLHGNGNDTRDPELDSLMREACEEQDLPWPPPDDADMQPYWDAEQDAYADLTYTERGYIPSDEWGIALDEHATRADVKAFISELAERHYSDDPVVDITRPERRPIPSGAWVNVAAHQSEPGKGLSYGAMLVRLIDPCETDGWDVIDVRLPDGTEASVYSFSVERRA